MLFKNTNNRMIENYKLIAFAVLVKRKYRNSALTSFRTRKKAEEFGLSVNTFRKYINACIETGWAYKDDKNQLRFIRLKDILSSFHKQYKINIGYYDLLTRIDVENNFKNVYDLLAHSVINENVRMRQEYNIRLKDLSAGKRLTKKQSKAFRREILKNFPDIVTKPEEYKQMVSSGADAKTQRALSKTKGKKVDVICAVTSARHTSKITGLSKNKSNKLLRTENPFYKTHHRTFMIKGCTFLLFDTLRTMFQNATVVPLPNYDRIRISFGREILHKDQRIANIFELSEENPIKQLLKLHESKFLVVLDIIRLKQNLKGKKSSSTKTFSTVSCTGRKSQKSISRSIKSFQKVFSTSNELQKAPCSTLTCG